MKFFTLPPTLMLAIAATYSPGKTQVSARGGHGGLIRQRRIGMGSEKNIFGELKQKSLTEINQ
jgi:hypothetical protein